MFTPSAATSATALGANTKKRAKWYRKASDQGFAHAQNALGVLYAQGLGGAADSAQAVKYYRMAAEQGHPMAQMNLASAYEAGEGVSPDDGKAINWYRSAIV